MPINNTSASEAAKNLVATRQATRRRLADLGPDLGNLAELVAHIYSYAGFTDDDANGRGNEVLQVGWKVRQNLENIERGLGDLLALLKTASTELESVEAKRKVAVSKLKV